MKTGGATPVGNRAIGVEGVVAPRVCDGPRRRERVDEVPTMEV